MMTCRSKTIARAVLCGLCLFVFTRAAAQDGGTACDTLQSVAGLLQGHGGCMGNVSPGFKATEHRGMLMAGAVNSLDTYLSPLTYRGTELRFTSQTVHNRPLRNWTHSLTHGLRLARETMRTNDGVRLEGGYDFSYSWQRKIVNRTIGYWGRLMVTAGAGVDATVGFRYHAQNSNNPAQAEAAVCFTPAMAADWRFFLVSPKNGRRHTLGMRYELAVPLAGMMFSPAFGQSYYEIFSRGDYDHNLCPVWVGNALSVRQRLLFTFKLLGKPLFIGYEADIRQAHVNDIKYHRYTHAAVAGWQW